MESKLTMLDYLKRIGVDLAPVSAAALDSISTLDYPEMDCGCRCCSKPKTAQFYDIPGRGAWLVEAHDHTNKLLELQRRFPGTVRTPD